MATENKLLNITVCLRVMKNRHNVVFSVWEWLYNNSCMAHGRANKDYFYQMDCIFQELLYYLFHWIGHVLKRRKID